MRKRAAVIIGVLLTVLVFAAYYLYNIDLVYTHWILLIPVILFAYIDFNIGIYYSIGIGLSTINYIVTLSVKDREKSILIVENIVIFLIVAYVIGVIVERIKKKDDNSF